MHEIRKTIHIHIDNSIPIKYVQHLKIMKKKTFDRGEKMKCGYKMLKMKSTE